MNIILYVCLFLIVSFWLAGAARAQVSDGGSPVVLPEVSVAAPADGAFFAPDTASQGVVTGKEIEEQPRSRVGEVLEVVPGLIATQHSGEGKANQYFLRGFNLDHGTDIDITLDEMPGQHAHPCAWPRLCRPQLYDPRADQHHALQQGPLFPGSRRF